MAESSAITQRSEDKGGKAKSETCKHGAWEADEQQQHFRRHQAEDRQAQPLEATCFGTGRETETYFAEVILQALHLPEVAT